MATYKMKTIPNISLESYDAIDATLVLLKGQPLAVQKNQEEGDGKDTFLVIGDGVTQFSQLPLYILTTSLGEEVDLSNLVAKDDIIVGEPIDAATLKTIMDEINSPGA